MNPDSERVVQDSIPHLTKDVFPTVLLLKNALQNHLQAVLPNELELASAIKGLLRDDGLGDEEKDILRLLLRIEEIHQCMLPILDYATDPEEQKETDDKLSLSIMNLARSVHAGPDNLLELLPNDLLQNLQIDVNVIWGRLRERLFLEEATAAILGMLQSKKLPVPFRLDASAVAVVRTAIEKFDFNIQRDTIRQLLGGERDRSNTQKNVFAAAKISEDHQPALQEYLVQLQQMLSLTSEFDDFQRLVACGYKTVEAVVEDYQKSLDTLVQRGVSHERAKIIFKRASIIAIRNEYVWIEALRARGTKERVKYQSYNMKGELVEQLAVNGVNLSTMFLMDNMREDDGISLSSPAAFFFHLLRWLQNVSLGDPTRWEDSLLAKLFERRPDLQHLDLSYLNTSIEIPYIDLVNEILEAVVLGESETPEITLPPFNMQPDDKNKRVVSEPQHTRLDVYEKIVQPMVFPMTVFPYNQAIHSTRVLLDACGTPRIQVFETLFAPDKIGTALENHSDSDIPFMVLNRALAAEVLGLQHEDYIAIVRESFYPPKAFSSPGTDEYLERIGCRETWEYWGYTSREDMLSPIKGLTCILKETMPRSGLSYEELRSITACRYFIDKLAIQPKDEKEYKGQLDQLILVEKFKGGKIKAPQVDICQRLQAFIRLWRKLSWTLIELDIFLSMFVGTAFIDANVVYNIACTQQLSELTKMPLAELQPLWGEMDTFDYESQGSLYRRRFLQLGHPDQIFFPKKSTSEISEYFQTDSNIADHLPTILEGVQLTMEEYLEIKDLVPTRLTLSSLTQLYRISTLCKMLGIPVDKYKPLIHLYSITSHFDPFQDPSTTLALVKEHKSSRFSLDELLLICTDITIKSKDPYNPTEENVEKVSKAMIEGFFATQHYDCEIPLSSPWQIVVEHLHPYFPDVEKNVLEYFLSVGVAAHDTLLRSRLEVLLTWETTRFTDKFPMEPDISIPTMPDSLVYSMNPYIISTIGLVVKRLMRIAIIVRRCGLQRTEIAMLQDPKIAFVHFNRPDLSELRRIEQYCQLREIFPNTEKKNPLPEFYTSLYYHPPSTIEQLISSLVSLSGWSSEICLSYVMSKYALDDSLNNIEEASRLAESFQNLPTLVEMSNSIALFCRLRLPDISLEQLFSMAQPSLPREPADDFQHEIALREGIRNLRIAPGSGTTFDKAYDEIRVAQRDAMIQCLLAQTYARKHGIGDAEELFEHLLIDVQMGPVLQTSRLKQAISTVQIFVQRCLLGVEVHHGIEPSKLRANKSINWDTIFRYRLWEAERKILLYPETWADPTVRDDKTEQFQEFETAMAQTQLDQESIAELTKGYIHEVEKVCNIEIVSFLWDRTPFKTGKRNDADLHFFGRTRTQPVSFYYRKLQIRSHERYNIYDTYFWTSWEKLDIDVPVYASDADGKRLDKPGSYIIPAVIQGRLTLFIPEITLGQSSKNDSVLSGEKTGQELLKEKISLSSNRWWEIRMGRTERRNGKWIAKTVSPEVFRVMPTGEEKVPSIDGFRFWLRVRESDDGKVIPYLDVEHQDTTNRTADPSTRTGYIQGCDECNTRHMWNHAHVAYYGSIESHGHQVICSVLPEHSEIFDTLDGDEMRFHIITRAERGPFGGKNMLAPFYAIRIDGEEIPEESFRRWPISLDEAHYSSQIGPKALVFDNVTANHGYLQYIGIPCWDTDRSSAYYLYNFMNPAIAGLVDCIHNGGEIDTVHTYFESVGSNGTVARDTFGWLEDETESFFHERVRPFAIYNWELGVHIPLMMAERLMVMQQYDLALETLRTVFDPAISSDDPIQCWRFPPFLTVATKLRNHSKYPSSFESRAMERTLKELLASGNNNVHIYARNYPEIYMKRIVLKYIEILINMGDVFFRQATLESIPLAIERYIQASHIFGPRPVIIPNLIEPEAKTYQGLRWSETDFQQNSFTMALEILPCGDMAVLNAHKLKPQGFFKSEYFSIPANPYIIELRNRIDQRLHNIRNGLDINGNPMSLELFELPIDPSQVLAGQVLRSIGGSAKLFSSQGGPIPRYRFRYLIRQAYELVNELRLASQQLMQIKEKKDAEAIWLLRVKHKRTLLGITKRIKTNQKLEVEKGIEVLQETRKQLEMRLSYHLQLTGDSPTIPNAEGEAWTDVIQSIAPPTTDDLRMSPFELDEMNFTEKASDLRIEAGWLDASAAAAFAIPNFSIKAQPMGMGMDTSFGGYILGQLILAKAAVVRLDAQEATDNAVRAARTGAIVKQLQERRLEINVTGREIVKADRKIKQLRVRLAVCDADIKAHQQEVENAAAEEEWLRTKYTSKELYTFLDNSMSVIFKQTYTIAADMAALARHSLNFEHATRFNNDSKLPNIVNYWNNSHDGHLAAEAMYLDLKQLEKLYIENRAHDFEIRKSISLRRLSPIELLKLRETGEAILDIPEALFDMDYPGHFCRRISSVSVSIPCILGAYTSLSCTLRLTKHSYRISPDLKKPEEDALREDVIPITSIAVSNGVQDSGTFNLDFRGTDEYGPFEGAGAISTWKIELPNTFRPFDYHTISDVVLHLQYTSINGGEELKTAASQAAESFISESGTSALAIDLKHDYSSEWRNLASTGQLHLKNVVNRMPFWTHGQNRPVKVNTITLYLYPQKPASATVRVGGSVILLESATADALSQYALVKTDINEPLADQWMIENLPKEEVYERGWLVIGYSAGQSA